MSGRSLFIREISRTPAQGLYDKLTFRPGVNVVVGPPNTGKSKWLRMLDYLFGDDGTPQDVFGEILFEKYDSVEMVVSLNGDDLKVKREWKKTGVTTRISVDDELLSRDQYTELLAKRLEIPPVHYPQGNPYGLRAWPLLGWRSLFRHVYRRQEFWSDLADKQPPSEQHACLLQFLGLAQYLFSEQYGSLVEKEKKVAELEMTRQQFIDLLQEISKEIVQEKELGVALTPESIDSAIARLNSDIKKIEEERSTILKKLLATAVSSKVQTPDSSTSHDAVSEMTERLSQLQVEEEQTLTALKKNEARITEVTEQEQLISDELAKLRRSREAGEILSELRITHCPACDREISRRSSDTRDCYLCGRPFESQEASDLGSIKRLDFEVEQLGAELSETHDLLSQLRNEGQLLRQKARSIDLQIEATKQSLRPIRRAVAAILPPEIAAADMKMGRLQERMSQLRRIGSALDRRSKIADQIAQIRTDILALQSEVDSLNKTVDFDRAADDLTDGMNTYLNAISKINPKSWTQDPVQFSLDERTFRVRIGRNNWSTKLGGTLSLYFLISYHYSLLSLCQKRLSNFPGLCILDFPAELEDGSAVADKENFVLEPFINLLNRSDMNGCQMIAAGSAFESLPNANRIELKQIWR